MRSAQDHPNPTPLYVEDFEILADHPKSSVVVRVDADSIRTPSSEDSPTSIVLSADCALELASRLIEAVRELYDANADGVALH